MFAKNFIKAFHISLYQTFIGNNHLQDTTTQAMTEVALGLSMAFFALLVLALISISLPSNNDTLSNQTSDIPQDKLLQLHSSQNPKADAGSGKSQTQMLILYWKGQYFNIQKEPVQLASILGSLEKASNNRDLVVAVSASTDLHQLLNIQSAFAQRDIKLTKLSAEWEAAFEQDSLNKK